MRSTTAAPQATTQTPGHRSFKWSLFRNSFIWGIVGLIDYCNSTAIYISNITPALFLVFHQVLRFIFLPISAALSLCHLGFALSQLIIDRDEKNNIKKRHAILVGVNFISSCLGITLVIGTLAFATAFQPAFPFLLGANLILAGGYQFTTMAYFFYQALQKEKLANQNNTSTEDRETLLYEAKQEKYIAKIRFLFGVTVLFFAVSTIAVLSTGILPLASIGLTGAVIGIALCLYGLQRLWKDTA
jgi:hypothetical protein